MEEVQIEAPAKINIGLDVVGKREDGYHLVRMIMQTVALSDTIVVKRETQGVSMQCIGEGEAKTLETDDRNLCIRAANLMKKNHALSNGYTISLTKRIPIQAGMAGGSTDAAAVMLAINRLENLKLSEDTLMKEAVAIGADVPYCILKKTALA